MNGALDLRDLIQSSSGNSCKTRKKKTKKKQKSKKTGKGNFGEEEKGEEATLFGSIYAGNSVGQCKATPTQSDSVTCDINYRIKVNNSSHSIQSDENNFTDSDFAKKVSHSLTNSDETGISDTNVGKNNDVSALSVQSDVNASHGANSARKNSGSSPIEEEAGGGNPTTKPPPFPGSGPPQPGPQCPVFSFLGQDPRQGLEGAGL